MDYKIWISIYAAVISTVVFAWRLYEFYYDRIGKLDVNIKYTFRTIVYGNGNIGEMESFLIISVVNIGKNKRFIEQPRFQINANFEGKKYMNLARTDIIKTYPVCLEPGEKFEYDLPYKEFKDDLQRAGVRRIKARVYDTHGKVYCSKWFKL
jgi:hypothetical protein